MTSRDNLAAYPEHTAKSYEDLAQRLIDNGLGGVTADELARHLERIGYFRLKGYWYPFLTPSTNIIGKRSLPFLPSTTFPEVLNRYRFDSELRMLVFEGIVIIENYLKSYISCALSAGGKEFGFLDNANLPNLSFDQHLHCLKTLRDSFSKSQLPYILHFRNNYSNPLPPYWMIVGTMSFGSFKEYFYQGAPKDVKKSLAQRLGIVFPGGEGGNDKLLSQWLEVIRRVRNMVAHHDRLWNSTDVKIGPELPLHRTGKHSAQWWGNKWDVLRNDNSHKVGAVLAVENHILQCINEQSWSTKLHDFMLRYPTIPLEEMGLPEDWDSCPLWR